MQILIMGLCVCGHILMNLGGCLVGAWWGIQIGLKEVRNTTGKGCPEEILSRHGFGQEDLKNAAWKMVLGAALAASGLAVYVMAYAICANWS